MLEQLNRGSKKKLTNKYIFLKCAKIVLCMVKDGDVLSRKGQVGCMKIYGTWVEEDWTQVDKKIAVDIEGI